MRLAIDKNQKKVPTLGFIETCVHLQFRSWALALWYGTQLVKNDGAAFDKVLKVFLVIVSVGFGVAEAASLAPDVAKGGTATESVFAVRVS